MRKFTILLILMTCSAQASITGEARNKFITMVSNGCYQVQVNAPINKKIDKGILNKYCTCYATYMADIPEMTSKMTKAQMAPYAIKAGNYCASNY